MKRLTLTLVLLILSGLASSSLYAQQTVNPNMVEKWPDSRYIVNEDKGTVIDTVTGLMWQRCLEGKTGTACAGDSSPYTWAEALGVPAAANRAALGGHTNWRLPNSKELTTLIAWNRPQHINNVVFPEAKSRVWSSTISLQAHSRDAHAMVQDLSFSIKLLQISFPFSRNGISNVRLVRRYVDAAPSAITTGKLNDTGIADCMGEATKGQDCSHGRDSKSAAELNKVGSGAAGFDFTKLDSEGKVLADQSQPWDNNGNEPAGTKWSCVRDNVTGLVWEVKTNDNALHHKDDSYTWYSTNSQTNGSWSNGDATGVENVDGDTCSGYVAGEPKTYCNTEAYVARVNQKGFCGAVDWRLPDQNELTSIVHYGVSGYIDADFFPNMQLFGYWTSWPHGYDDAGNTYSWEIDFSAGGTDVLVSNETDNHVRLVRGKR